MSHVRKSLALLAAMATVAAVSPAVADHTRVTETGGTLTNFAFGAMAYGSRSQGPETANADPTAVSYLPCTRFVPRDRSNHVATSDEGGVATQNADTHNFTHQQNGVTTAISIATVQDGTLAGGSVGFTDLRSKNVSSHVKGQGFKLKQVSSIGSLTVAGAPVPIPDDGNTFTVPVPGRGTLTVHHKIPAVSSSGAFGIINTLKFDGDDGSVQTVAHSQSKVENGVEGGLFRGAAWASEATVADAASSRRGAYRPIPCPGTDGVILKNATGEAAEEGGVIGARRSFAYGLQRANGSATGYTRSVVDAAQFGVLELRNIRGNANVTRRADNTVLRDAKGTGVGEILINGEQQPQPAAGESQPFPGGEYTIRVVVKNPIGIDATGAVVRVFNNTPEDRTDDTVFVLAHAELNITKG